LSKGRWRSGVFEDDQTRAQDDHASKMITKMIIGMIIFEGAGTVDECSCHREVPLAVLDFFMSRELLVSLASGVCERPVFFGAPKRNRAHEDARKQRGGSPPPLA
jgi:hypothetical protein